MPIQHQCSACPCRAFYVMLQDDGSVQVFCTVNNHPHTLVNIPELVEHLYKTESEDSLEEYAKARGQSSGTEEEEASSQGTPYDSSNLNGSHSATDMYDSR